MIPFDSERVRDNVRKATTEDLLDRATVYSAEMEPEALEIIAEELEERGIQDAEIRDHAAQREQTTILRSDGTVLPCSFCARPAVDWFWHWHRIWGVLPILPHYVAICSEHAKAAAAGDLWHTSVFPSYFMHEQPPAR